MNPTALSSSRTALRSLQAVALNQLPQIVGSALFILLVPRRLGPEVYGQLAFCFAFIILFQAVGDLGYQEIFARWAPEMLRDHGPAAVRGMAWRLFGVKAGVGLLLGAAAALFARMMAGWLSPVEAGLIGLAVAGRIWSMIAYPLLLGLGDSFKWTVEATWRQIVLTALVLLLVPQPSLTLALAALALHEFIFAAMGWYWVRPYVVSPKSAVYSHATVDIGLGTVGFLRFGLGFSLANFSLVLLFRLGPILVLRLGGSPAEAGFFDLALGAWLLLYTLLERFAFALIPVMVHVQMPPPAVDEWVGRFVRYATVLAVLAAGGMWTTARALAPLIFGAGFEAAAQVIQAMAPAALLLPVAWAAVLLSVLTQQPGRKVRAALLGLTVFLPAAWLLRNLAAAGVALAFGLGMAGYAAGFGALTGRAIRAGGVRWGIALGLAVLFAPLLLLYPLSVSLVLGAWLAVAAVYLGVMLLARVAQPGELRQLADALRR